MKAMAKPFQTAQRTDYQSLWTSYFQPMVRGNGTASATGWTAADCC